MFETTRRVVARAAGPLLVALLAVGCPLFPAAAQERHADPGLEARLPDNLAGVALVRESQRGDELSRESPAFAAFLAGLGAAAADFSVASAYARTGLSAEVGAWHVAGADPARLLPGFVAAVQASSAVPLAQAEVELAGRRVTRIGDAGQMARGPLYVVRSGDVLLFVQTPVPALAAAAVGGFSR